MTLYHEDRSYLNSLVTGNCPLDPELMQRSVALPNSKKPGFSHVYRNAASPERLIETIHPALNTLYEFWVNAVESYATHNCLGTRPFNPQTNAFEQYYNFETYQQINTRRHNVGSGILTAVRNNPFRTPDMAEDNFIVALFSHNRAEWMISDLACVSYSLTDTALYDTLGPDASRYILNSTESPILICSKEKIEGILQMKEQYPEDLRKLIVLVSMDPLNISDELYGIARDLKIILYDFGQLEKLGALSSIPERPPLPETVYTISFTSGTTGANPKGVILTQKVASTCLVFGKSALEIEPSSKQPVSYSFLPLAHIYERGASALALASGYAIGYPPTNSPATLIEDLKILKPNVLSAVPRVYTKIESLLKDQTINSHKNFTRNLMRKVVGTKMELQATRGDAGEHFLYDKTVIRKIRKQLGFDNIRNVITGSAPISKETAIFLKAILGVGFCQGYGLTESFGGMCVTSPWEKDPGSCGPVGITCEMKTKDIPEMGYTANDSEGPRGELLLRGPQIFVGYFKNEEETKKAIDEEGWFHTGDIAKVDSQGRLHIIDRVKNFFKLAQGEYITPEKIENIYLSSCSLISQLYVHGDSFQTQLIAIVGVEPTIIGPWLKRTCGFKDDELDSNDKLVKILKQKEIKAKLLAAMNKSVLKSGLQGFEKIHNIDCDIEPLTVERNVVTPTLKIKRAIASKFFKDVFDGLYKEGSLVKKEKRAKL